MVNPGRVQTERTASELAAAFGGSPFSRAQAESVGVSIGRLRAACHRGTVTRLSPGVYAVDGAPIADEGLLHIRHALTGLDDLRIAVTGRAGAELHQLPFIKPSGRNDTRHGVEVIVHADDAARCGRLATGVIVRPWEPWPEDVTSASGIPVVAVLHAAIDSVRMGLRPWHRRRAEALPLPEALVLLDAATKRSGASDTEQATRLIEAIRPRFWHCAGIASVDVAAPHINPRSESPLESWSRGYMVEYGVPMPLLQQVVTGADGTDYRVDFCWPELKIIGEADGLEKYGNTPEQVRDAKRREHDRQRALEAAGWIIIRWSWDELARDPYAVIRRIMSALRRAA
ncbi:MAG: hypothetical protein RL347_814 [Actinomycetota bacterium]